MADCWPEVGTHPEGLATGQHDIGFSWFSTHFKQTLRWFQVVIACPSSGPLDLNSSSSSGVVKATKIIFPNSTSTFIQEMIILCPLSQAAAANHPDVFITTLPYQRDEMAKPGNVLAKRCSFCLPPPVIYTFVLWSVNLSPPRASDVAVCQIKDLPIIHIWICTLITCSVGLVMNKIILLFWDLLP
jgi:hypothetical protein